VKVGPAQLKYDTQTYQINIMDSKSYQAYEQNTPMLGVLEPSEPTKARRRRMFFVKGLVIASALFLWWSYYAIPAHFEFGRKGTVAHEIEGDDGIGFEDFDTVGWFRPHVEYKQ
jgi:hypothetical protein